MQSTLLVRITPWLTRMVACESARRLASWCKPRSGQTHRMTRARPNLDCIMHLHSLIRDLVPRPWNHSSESLKINEEQLLMDLLNYTLRGLLIRPIL